jgi:branched-chain amino acid transport system permease protein
MNALLSYQSLFDAFLISLGFAYSQQVVLRSGVFSVATAGFASVGAYCAAILTKTYGLSPIPSLGFSLALGGITGYLLALPLSRLRGIYQAIATLAFVEIVTATMLSVESITGGGFGINDIPKSISSTHLVVISVGLVCMMGALKGSRIGRAFDAIAQDETVGSVLGISVRKNHTLAFALSGAIGGLYGGLESLHSYSLLPGQYSFDFVISVLAFVVVGGRRSLFGPILGVAFLVLLPEIARPFAAYRPMMTGLIMVMVVNYMPSGLADTAILSFKKHRVDRPARANGERHVKSAT